MTRDWRDMRPEEFDTAHEAGVGDDGLFPLPVTLVAAPVDECGTGDLFADLDQ